jgi:hypothetical protein
VQSDDREFMARIRQFDGKVIEKIVKWTDSEKADTGFVLAKLCLWKGEDKETRPWPCPAVVDSRKVSS